MKYKVSGLACVAAGALTAVALSFAQTAHADEASFLVALSNDDIPVTAAALPLGHDVCGTIGANGSKGAATEFALGTASGFSHADAYNFIYDAVTQLCPSEYPALSAWSASLIGA